MIVSDFEFLYYEKKETVSWKFHSTSITSWLLLQSKFSPINKWRYSKEFHLIQKSFKFIQLVENFVLKSLNSAYKFNDFFRVQKSKGT